MDFATFQQQPDSASPRMTAQQQPLPHDGGWMERKQGKLKKSWRMHYYAMESSCLVEYFDSIGTSHTSRFYPFQRLSDVLMVDDHHPFVFSFRCDQRLYVFRVASAAAREDWVSKLRKASLQAHCAITPKSRSCSLSGADQKSMLETTLESTGCDLDTYSEDESSDSSNSDGGGGEEEEPKQWTHRVRRFLSLSKDEGPRPAAASAASAASSVLAALPESIPNRPYELRSVTVLEYDVVEVFENQRWFPITGWSSKLMKHDRASVTSRHGHNRVQFYKQSLSSGDNACEGTMGDEDAAEIPGAQVHVIKEPWRWHSPQWQVRPLIGLPPLVPSQQHQQQHRMGGESHSASSSPPISPSNPGTNPASRTFSLLKRTVGLSGLSAAATATTAAAATAATTIASALPLSLAMETCDEGWCVGIDFPDFDAAIARGVQLTYPAAISLMRQVRTRRLVRVRVRAVTVTARLPESGYFPLFPSILSFQRQVICEGWLGVRLRRVWRSKYCKLIRYCDGVWDGNGLGCGMVDSRPSVLHLVAFECKETHQRDDSQGKSIVLLGTSSARMSSTALFHERAGAEDELSSSPSFALTRDRFAMTYGGEDMAIPVDPKLESRSGRFELHVDAKRHFLFSADTCAECAVWTKALNAGIDELRSAEEEDEGEDGEEGEDAYEDDGTSPRTAAAKIPGMLLKRLKQSPFKPRSRTASSTGEEPASKPCLPPTGSPLEGVEITQPHAFPCPIACNLLSNTSADGKLKEWVDFELHVSLEQFFSLFYAEQAKYSSEYFHREGGDINIKVTPWTQGCVIKPADEFDFDLAEEHSRERMLTCQMYTGSSIAPLTRVEKHQRYYYYPRNGLFVMRSTSHSLDIPFADAFLVVERWVVQQLDGCNKVRVRINCDPVFSKPPFGFILGQIKKNCNLQIPRALYAFREKTTKMLNHRQGEVVAVGGAVAVEPAVVAVAKDGWQATERRVVLAVVLAWMWLLLAVLYRVAVALEALASKNAIA